MVKVLSKKFISGEEILKNIGKDIADDIKDILASENVNASGKLSNSVEPVVLNDWSLEIIGKNYFEYVENGREPGKVPAKFGEILAQWVKDKHISVPSKFKDEISFGYAIANTIKRYGSLRHRTKSPADLLPEDKIDEWIIDINERISGEFLEAQEWDINSEDTIRLI